MDNFGEIYYKETELMIRRAVEWIESDSKLLKEMYFSNSKREHDFTEGDHEFLRYSK